MLYAHTANEGKLKMPQVLAAGAVYDVRETVLVLGRSSCLPATHWAPMRYRSLLALLFATLVLSVARAQSALPADVARFVEQRDGCDHFRGEDPYDAERAKFLKERTRELCAGTDRRLKVLKEKYKTNPQVLSKLNEYEPQIEWSE